MAGAIDWLKEVLDIGGAPKQPKAAATPRNSAPRAERARPPRQSRNNSYQRIETVNMRSYSEAMIIADILRDGTTAIINVSGLSSTDRARLVDFMAGLKAGLLAESQRVSEDVYLLAPNGVEIDADDEEGMEDDGDRLVIRP